MEHVVFFPAPDGTPAFRRLPSLDDAARFVEHLRNVENVSEASVHSLTEIPLQFKAWYRVELPAGVASAADITGLAVAEPDGATEVASVYSPVQTSRGSAVDASVFEGVEFDSAAFEAAGFDGAVVEPAPSQGYASSEPSLADADLQHVAPSPGSATGIVVAEPATMPAMQVLEPVAGTRRDRGIGFFAR